MVPSGIGQTMFAQRFPGAFVRPAKSPLAVLHDTRLLAVAMVALMLAGFGCRRLYHASARRTLK